jgi:hypothetical protein
MSTFAYLRTNPIAGIDPLGLFEFSLSGMLGLTKVRTTLFAESISGLVGGIQSGYNSHFNGDPFWTVVGKAAIGASVGAVSGAVGYGIGISMGALSLPAFSGVISGGLSGGIGGFLQTSLIDSIYGGGFSWKRSAASAGVGALGGAIGGGLSQVGVSRAEALLPTERQMMTEMQQALRDEVGEIIAGVWGAFWGVGSDAL